MPAVWAMAVRDDPGPDEAKAVCAGGAHLVAEQALHTALLELGPILASVDNAYPANRERTDRMVRDATEVKTMTDHSLLYANPAAFNRFDFLNTGPTPDQSWTTSDMQLQYALIANTDLRDDLSELLGRFLDRGTDVIVVDQTTPELACASLACAKVIVPGLQSMTFGHANRRNTGNARLDAIAPSPRPDLPHPFP